MRFEEATPPKPVFPLRSRLYVVVADCTLNNDRRDVTTGRHVAGNELWYVVPPLHYWCIVCCKVFL